MLDKWGNPNKKTLILDLNGVVYKISRFASVKEVDRWDNIFAYRFIPKQNCYFLPKWKFRSTGSQQELEREIVSKNSAKYRLETLNILPEALEASNSLFRAYKVVVFSSSPLERIRKIIGAFLRISKQSLSFSDIELNSGAQLGRKTESKSWERLLTKYPQAEIIVDDSVRNHHAAQAAADNLSRTIQILSSLKELK